MPPLGNKSIPSVSVHLDINVAVERNAETGSTAAPPHVARRAVHGPLSALTPYAQKRRDRPSIATGEGQEANKEGYMTLTVSLHWRGPGIQSLSKKDVGPLIGQGSQKDVYKLKDDPASCVAVIRPDAIGRFDTPFSHAQREVSALSALHTRGFRTVQIHGLVRLGEQVGIKQRYLDGAQNSSDIVASGGITVPEGQYLTHRMVDDCDSTIATLRKTNTVVEDLQFLIEPSGDMHISDPRAVAVGNPEKNVGTVKELRGIALATLLSSDDE
ncbi:hypothetical protein MAFF211271_47190 (plasmid) [Ralstonia syzygii subsp. indonesiensis]|nr:hypothetical protein MAFF211271_47190 [Ralstonia pseudosolanacearum]